VTSVCVGNDVVDLERSRTAGRAKDARFVTRVLDVEEQEAVRAASEPDVELWCHWAAKEAGYKVISKLLGSPPPFVHRAFKVAWSEGSRGAASDALAGPSAEPIAAGPGREAATDAGTAVAVEIRRGTVGWEGRNAEVSVARLAGGVHAVAFAVREPARDAVGVEIVPRVELLDEPAAPWAGSLDELRSRFTEREADAVYSLASAAVRLGARGDLAARLGVSERRVAIVCGPGRSGRRPPRVFLDGGPVEADVSLSHDGRLIAWAIWVGRGQQMRS